MLGSLMAFTSLELTVSRLSLDGFAHILFLHLHQLQFIGRVVK
jgi:hypothetical protein